MTDPIPLPPELALDDVPFTDDDLDLALVTTEIELDADDEAGVAHQRVFGWLVHDEGDAEWAMRMLVAIDLERQGLREQAKEWKWRIDEWLRDATALPDKRHAFFEDRLAHYALQVRHDDPKKATIPLPSGKLTTRAAQTPTVEMVDEDAVLEWAAETLAGDDYEACVRVTTHALISELRKRVTVVPINEQDKGHVGYAVTYDGKAVPGLAASLDETTASVKPDLSR